jgi:ribosome-associated protein
MQPEGAIERAPHRVAVRRQIAADDALKAILTSLEDSKAEDIVTIDIAGKSALADYMVVASGRSQRHVSAIAEHIDRDLSEAGGRIARIEGVPHCDWVLLDAGDVIVHIFRPEVRSFYNLEKMWAAADEPQPVSAKAPAQDASGV